MDPIFESKLKPLTIEWHGSASHDDDGVSFRERMRERMAKANGERIKRMMSNVELVPMPVRIRRKA